MDLIFSPFLSRLLYWPLILGLDGYTNCSYCHPAIAVRSSEPLLDLFDTSNNRPLASDIVCFEPFLTITCSWHHRTLQRSARHLSIYGFKRQTPCSTWKQLILGPRLPLDAFQEPSFNIPSWSHLFLPPNSCIFTFILHRYLFCYTVCICPLSWL